MTYSEVLVFKYKSTIDEELPAIRDFMNKNFTETCLVFNVMDHLTTHIKGKGYYNGAELSFCYKGVPLLKIKPLHENKGNRGYGIDLHDGKLLSWRHQVVVLGSCLLTASLVVANLYGLFSAPAWVMHIVAVTPALLLWILW